MINKYTAPHWLSFLLLIPLVVFWILWNGKSWEIQLHDTYYVFSLSYFIVLFSVILAASGTVYYFLLKKYGGLYPKWILRHFLLSVTCVVLPILLTVGGNLFAKSDALSMHGKLGFFLFSMVFGGLFSLGVSTILYLGYYLKK
jgi:hypothetical protein